MLDNITYGTFIFFGVRIFTHIEKDSALTDVFQAFSFLGGLFIQFLVPETKGLSLEEMDEVFGSAGMAAGENARFIEIERRIGLDAYNDPDANRSSPAYDRKEDLEKV